jgi:hypothetical protein
MTPKGAAVSASVATDVMHRNPPMGHSPSEWKRDSSWRNRSRKRVPVPAASESTARVAVEEAESRVVRAYRRDVDNGSERSCRIRFCRGHERDAQESSDGKLAKLAETRLFPAQSL